MHTLSLFDEPQPEIKTRLKAKLATLAAEGIYIGTSSWKYEGWLGQIYTPERYRVRGKFSRKTFEQECLIEYAETFPIVCGDFSFYQFPEPAYWQRLFSTAPAPLQFAFKVPEELTVKFWPQHPRYGPRAGMENPSFLNPEILKAMLLEPLEPWRARVAVLIFEFGAFGQRSYKSPEDFLADLDPFLAQLPPGWRYAVEIRNPEFLAPGYLTTLHAHSVAHVLNAWTRMPELAVQMSVPGTLSADFSVVRALLKAGRAYEDAVKSFSPYREIQEVNQSGRKALRTFVHTAREQRRTAFVFVNNRFEGNAPQTIDAFVDD